MKVKIIGVIFFVICVSGETMAQDKYWVYFRNKKISYKVSQLVSPQTENNRSQLHIPLFQISDLPVDEHYVKQVESVVEHRVIVSSKWLNAISIVLRPHEVGCVSSLPFVSRVAPINARITLASVSNASDQKQVEAIRQIHGEEFLKAGLSGKGVIIGIIDGGFIKANHTQSLKHIFSEGRVKSIRDFVAPEGNLLEDVISENDGHGTAVMQMIAGQDAMVKFGLATDASFYLARTDHGKYEFRGEEDYWVRALEWMDSLGVRLVNSSLGYSIDFDSAQANHDLKEVNGTTAAITKAAQLAVKEKAMILVNSAGNDGGNVKWNVVNLPADAPGVITVGATDWNGLKREYSSIGPANVSFVKPDVACYSDGGTSLAAPVITGVIACMLQNRPDLTSQQVANTLRASSSIYPYCNNFIGCGVPDVNTILSKLSLVKKVVQRSAVEVTAKGGEYSIPAHPGENALMFHKSSVFRVQTQDSKSEENNLIRIERPVETTRTTVLLSRRILEIVWK